MLLISAAVRFYLTMAGRSFLRRALFFIEALLKIVSPMSDPA